VKVSLDLTDRPLVKSPTTSLTSAYFSGTTSNPSSPGGRSADVGKAEPEGGVGGGGGGTCAWTRYDSAATATADSKAMTSRWALGVAEGGLIGRSQFTSRLSAFPCSDAHGHPDAAVTDGRRMLKLCLEHAPSQRAMASIGMNLGQD
jgi:hypothetical protein